MDVNELKSAIINLLSKTEDYTTLQAAYMVLYKKVVEAPQGGRKRETTSEGIELSEEGFPLSSDTHNFKLNDPED